MTNLLEKHCRLPLLQYLPDAVRKREGILKAARDGWRQRAYRAEHLMRNKATREQIEGLAWMLRDCYRLRLSMHDDPMRDAQVIHVQHLVSNDMIQTLHTAKVYGDEVLNCLAEALAGLLKIELKELSAGKMTTQGGSFRCEYPSPFNDPDRLAPELRIDL